MSFRKPTAGRRSARPFVFLPRWRASSFRKLALRRPGFLQ
jgi:hypothetical protein